jgi:hypothetical protein
VKGEFLTLFINRINDMTSDIALKEAKIGQGLTLTRWNGLNFFIIILFLRCIG